MLQDVRFALRLFLKRPGFSAVAILTLALGIGATTAIFTVVNAILLSPLPFPDAGRLVEVRIGGQGPDMYPLPDADFLAWRRQNQTAESIAVWWAGEPVTLTGVGAAERVPSAAVTDRFFDVLGARPLIGRTFQQGDDAPAAPKTAILSHRFWTRRFNADSNIVGRTVSLGGVAHTIVGVMPAGFRFPRGDIDVWRILPINPPSQRGPFYTLGIARLKPGTSIEQLRANLNLVTAGLKRQHPGPEDWTLEAVPLHNALVGDVKPVLYLLLGAVGFLLLIATANVANLLLARAATREREVALRGALGAGRLRIVRQLLTESVVLAVISGVLGLAIAAWGTRALLTLAPEGIPRLDEVRMSTPVFVFALAVAAACGIAFGLAPALRAPREFYRYLTPSSRSGLSAGHRRVQRLLVVAEMALALILSVGAGLMMRSFSELQRVSPGFDPGHLLAFQLSLPQTQYPDETKTRTFYDTLLQRLEALPGVRSAALAISLPPNLLHVTDNFMVEGQLLPSNQSAPVGPVVMVSDTYFRTLGVPLLRGRMFDARDEIGAPPVVIVNEALADKYFRGVDPIGRRFKIGGAERPIGPDNPWKTVVGVVGDVKYSGLDAAPEPTFYMPFRQNPWRGQYVAVRTASDPHALVTAIRGVVAELDPDVPVSRVKTMDELMIASVAPPRFRTMLVAIFAIVGLVLAAIGIYGVMAYAVAERTHELGVRIALGADRAVVLRLVLGEAMALTAIGIAAGVAGAFVATRFIQSLLFGVTPTDAATFTGISALLAATALVASYVPARRAMRVDPMVALRYE